MPFSEAAAIEPGMQEACHDYAFVRSFGIEPTDDMWFTQSDGTLTYVMSSLANGPRTAEGVGVGSTTADVLSAYPEAVVVSRNLHYLRVGNMFFGFRSDVVYEADQYQDEDGIPEEIIEVGATSGDILYEFCG